jgi:putative transposase
MEIIDPKTGQTYVRKRRVRYEEPGQPREFTFSCFRQFKFLSSERTCDWFRQALEDGRSKFGFQLWGYVVMPEHIHLLVCPGETAGSVPRFLQAIKEPVARKAIAHLKATAPQWLDRLTVREGKRVRHRFWQPDGGYDRNVTSSSALRSMIEYIHANPVRRGLVTRAEDWEWSSARWFAGMRPAKIEMDEAVRCELQWG